MRCGDDDDGDDDDGLVSDDGDGGDERSLTRTFSTLQPSSSPSPS